jgi:hypothetical protein
MMIFIKKNLDIFVEISSIIAYENDVDIEYFYSLNTSIK